MNRSQFTLATSAAALAACARSSGGILLPNATPLVRLPRLKVCQAEVQFIAPGQNPSSYGDWPSLQFYENCGKAWPVIGELWVTARPYGRHGFTYPYTAFFWWQPDWHKRHAKPLSLTLTGTHDKRWTENKMIKLFDKYFKIYTDDHTAGGTIYADPHGATALAYTFFDKDGTLRVWSHLTGKEQQGRWRKKKREDDIPFATPEQIAAYRGYPDEACWVAQLVYGAAWFSWLGLAAAAVIDWPALIAATMLLFAAAEIVTESCHPRY